MFHVKLAHELLKLSRHASGLVYLFLRDLTAVQHLLYLLLWVALKGLSELLILLNQILHTAERCIFHHCVEDRVIHRLFLSFF